MYSNGPPLRIKGYRNCLFKSSTYNSFVYLSKKTSLPHEDVILKYIPYEGPASLDEINNECYIQESLHHQFIMPLNKYFDIPNGFRVLEMQVASTNLNNLKALKKITQVYIIMFQISLAVEYMHSEKVLHGDIKPSNIVLNDDVENPFSRIIDFGHARKFTDNICQCNCLKITREFSAPEILRKEPHSFPADIWSLGATFYYIITGCNYNENSFLNFDKNFGPMLPKSGQVLIMQMLNQDPLKRPTAEMIVNSDFFKEVIGEHCIEKHRYFTFPDLAGHAR